MHPGGPRTERPGVPLSRPEPQFTVLIDGQCPLCRREAAFLSRLDAGRGRLALVDIAAPGFDASWYGTTQDEVMGTIHGVLPGGGLVRGMEVFRRAYGAVGWGWLTAPTGWPVLSGLFDRVYVQFARWRLAHARRRARRSEAACEGDRCRVPGA